MLPLREYIKKPSILFSALLRDYGIWIPDKWYLQLFYLFNTGKLLNLKKPQSFCEKIQWLKLYDRRPEYTMMVDKYAVKDYVAGIIGQEHIIPTLGVWDRPEDIDFDALPQQFVLKTTHGGGSWGVIICKDKSDFDVSVAVGKLHEAMKQDIYAGAREWAYKNVRRRIIAEKFIGNNEEELMDYKFFCFNGIPRYCQVISGRGHDMSIDFYDKNWTHQPFHEPKNYPFSRKRICPPISLQKMLDFSQLLSVGIPFIRVDFYEIDGHLYLGELTFYPTSGIGGFDPEEWDHILGNYITLLEG